MATITLANKDLPKGFSSISSFGNFWVENGDRAWKLFKNIAITGALCSPDESAQRRAFRDVASFMSTAQALTIGPGTISGLVTVGSEARNIHRDGPNVQNISAMLKGGADSGYCLSGVMKVVTTGNTLAAVEKANCITGTASALLGIVNSSAKIDEARHFKTNSDTPKIRDLEQKYRGEAIKSHVLTLVKHIANVVLSLFGILAIFFGIVTSCLPVAIIGIVLSVATIAFGIFSKIAKDKADHAKECIKQHGKIQGAGLRGSLASDATNVWDMLTAEQQRAIKRAPKSDQTFFNELMTEPKGREAFKALLLKGADEAIKVFVAQRNIYDGLDAAKFAEKLENAATSK